jgi:hypothetical protein
MFVPAARGSAHTPLGPKLLYILSSNTNIFVMANICIYFYILYVFIGGINVGNIYYLSLLYAIFGWTKRGNFKSLPRVLKF